MLIHSKLPQVGTTIFTVMSALAEQYKAINLSQGFPDFDTPDVLKKLVGYHVERGMNQYAPMPGLPILRGGLADKINRLYDIQIDPTTEITITAGGTQALFTAITAFVQNDDEVILIEPAYDSYAPSVELCGGVVKPYRMELSSQLETQSPYYINWGHFRELVTDKTRMIIINTPHNPTGTILKDSDLRELENIVKDSSIIVLSDEVYEHLIFDGEQHQSVLRFPTLFSRSIAVFSFGKTFHATGWKMGYVVAPEKLMIEFRKVHQFNVFSVNTPMQYAIAEYLQDEKTYLSLPYFYQSKRDYFLKLMSNSRFKPLKSSGTYFQLFSYEDISDESDTDFAKRMTTEWGVAAIPVSVFYSNALDSKVIRLCFAKEEKTLLKAAERLLLC